MPSISNLPILSIIIPSFNQLGGLKKTILSFKKQKRTSSYFDFEIIVIDGKSSDGSEQWINENENLISKAIIEKDAGIYDAMNKGVRIAKGKWVWFMGTGDLPSENWMDLLNVFLKNKHNTHTKLAAFGVHLLPPRESGVPEFYSPTWGPEIKWKNTIHHQGVIYSRALFKNNLGSISPFDLRYKVLADYHFHLKLWKNGLICDCKNEVLARVCPGGVSRQFNKSLYKEERELKHEVFNSLWSDIIQGIWTRLKWCSKKIA
ncbi:MAG: hypothetical protein COA49_08400 [Bacteroidetes bacterium]|nr:MAG: hypothetical protein COA49_08400 [Bacteroidota bacterium]